MRLAIWMALGTRTDRTDLVIYSHFHPLFAGGGGVANRQQQHHYKNTRKLKTPAPAGVFVNNSYLCARQGYLTAMHREKRK